jgi:ABC-2 type transport system permease protein
MSVRSIGMFFPTIHTQLTLNELTLADINNQLRFWKATEDFHEQKRLYFYPKIFSDFPVLQENWKQFKLGFFKDRAVIHWWKNILPLLLISVVLIITGNKKI